MNEKPKRLIGDDGELLVAVKVEKPKYPVNSSSLNQRLMLLALVLVLIFGGVAVAVVVVRNQMLAALDVAPSLATVPARFVHGPYEISFNMSVDEVNNKNPNTLPCKTRWVKVQINGRNPVRVYFYSSPNHGNIELLTVLKPDKRFINYTIPATSGDVFDIDVNDIMDNPFSGLKRLQFGTKDFPFCNVLVTFDPIGGTV
ncbi:MAG: hypothetical protein ABI970_20340 [Chloroflexota bacterium]